MIVKLGHQQGHQTLVKHIRTINNSLKVTPDHYVIIMRQGEIMEIPSLAVRVGDHLVSNK